MPKSKLKSKSKSNKSNKSKSSESTEKQFVIRLVPKEQEQANILIESGHIPYLQLSMKSTKPLRSVLEHLNRKWKEAFVKSPKYDSYVILFPVSAPKDRAGWCLQNSDGVLVRDLAEDNPIQGYLSLEYFWKIEQKEEKNTNENLKENTIENPKGKPIENINQNSISNFFANSFNNIDIPENEKKYNKNIKRGKKAKAKKGEKNIKQARRKRKKKSKIRNEKPSQNKIQEKKFMEQFSRAEEQEKSSKKARMLKGKNKISNKMKNKLSAKKNRQKSKQENLFPNNDSNLGNFANNFSNTKMDSILQLDSTPLPLRNFGQQDFFTFSNLGFSNQELPPNINSSNHMINMSQLNSNFSQNSNLFRVNSPNLTDSQDKKTSIGLNFEPSQPGFLFQQPTPTNSFLVSPLHSQLNYPSFLSDFKFSTDSAIFSQNSQNIFNSLNKNNDSNFAKLTPPKSTDSKINIPSDNKLQSFRQKLSFYESESRENSKSTDSNSAQVSSNDSNVHYDLINPENSTELIF